MGGDGPAGRDAWAGSSERAPGKDDMRCFESVDVLTRLLDQFASPSITACEMLSTSLFSGGDIDLTGDESEKE